MMIVDFHVHSTFSIDGISTMEQHCIAAIQKGIRKICFTEHVDYNIAEYNMGKVKDNREQNFNIEEYFNEIERLNALYYQSIEILSGVEFSEPHLFKNEFEYYSSLPFDYILASIHHCYNGVFPGKANIEESVAMKEYYSLMKESLDYCLCQGIAHLDFPRRYFDSWKIEEKILNDILITIIKKNIALEVNTSSVDDNCIEPLPCFSVIERYQSMGGKKVILGSDAHDCKRIGNAFEETMKRLPRGMELGYIKDRKFIPL